MQKENFFQAWKQLQEWSLKAHQDLPWRKNRNLYYTLVSEVMLQQTTVQTVIPKFEAFINKFPTWGDLQQAQLDDVLALWSGLGYYQRVRRLHALVQSTSLNYFSENIEKEKWNGIGLYTKNALLAIGQNKNAVALDANVKRILSRQQIDPQSPELFQLFELYGPRVVHEALMDLGRVYCKARSPYCSECFFSTSCPSSGQVVDEKIVKKQIHTTLLRFIVHRKKENLLLGEEKKSGQWLQGYRELPTFSLSSEEGLDKQYLAVGDFIEDYLDLQQPLFQIKNTITKYKFENLIYHISEQKFLEILEKLSYSQDKYQFFKLDQKFSSLTHKILEKCSLALVNA